MGKYSEFLRSTNPKARLYRHLYPLYIYVGESEQVLIITVPQGDYFWRVATNINFDISAD